MYKISRDIRTNTVKKRSRNFYQSLKNQAKEFCLQTGLHGYKYIAQSERSKLERIIWAIVVFMSLFCAGFFMRTAWLYNSARPTIMVIESTHHGIWNYPFPAVTLCNLNRVSLSGAKALIKKLALPEAVSEEFILSEMKLMNELLYPGTFGYDVSENLTLLHDIFEDNGMDITSVVESITQNCSDLILRCKWRGNWTECSKLFVRSYSRDGLCCSFNYITTEDPRIPPTQEPKRVSACGYQTGLSMLVNVDPNDYWAGALGSYGIKIMLHYPFDYPDNNAENKLVGMKTQVLLSVAPEEIYSTGEVEKLAVKTRDCIFEKERKISQDYDINLLNLTYAQYSYKNCMAACRASTIKEKCGCIPYYYPQKGTRICNLRDAVCLKHYLSWYETSWPGVSVSGDTIASMKINHYNRPCGCLPDCTMYRFPVEGSIGMIDRSNLFPNMRKLAKLADENGTMVHIFFNDLVSIQYRRYANYNWRSVFASFGGLLGLFVGFSLMSAYELIYFFVIRVVTDGLTKKNVEKIQPRDYDRNTIKRRGF